VWKKNTSSDGESNCTDSELWLCKNQKKLSQRSKKLSQKRKSRNCTRNSIGDETLYANSSAVADVLSPKEEIDSSKNSHQMHKYVNNWLAPRIRSVLINWVIFFLPFLFLPKECMPKAKP